ncbi:hypothetical protein KFE25_009344 [Diacronema lutheri]|uniref:non-specific serine/threonine protein kinase n=1 Tax=Diacronema lutheri TaxID=2081491 RepID=A0A8J5XSK5_DIALT|nr:hypothetical protein KFE25_009344 [Diacronema lutheri]
MDAYTKLHSIGHSASAEVFVIEERLTRIKYVMKQMQLGSGDREFAMRESALLRTLHHPNICRHHESFVHKGEWLCVVMPHCSNGDLAQLFRHRRDKRLPPLDEAVAVHYIMCISLACQYLHERKVIHRDIKPSNIFLASDWTVQLGDFGVSRQLSDASSLASTCVGTPLYMSPELLQSNKYSTKTDMWALGCVGFECVTLHPAFTGSSFTEIAEKVIGGEYGRLPARSSMPFRDAIRRLLSVDPDERPSAKQLLNSLLLRRPLRAHLARIDAGEPVGMSAAAGSGYSEQRSLSAPDMPTAGAQPGAADGGGGTAASQRDTSASASASRAARRAAVPADERPALVRGGSSGFSLAAGDSPASSERLQRALHRRSEVRRYLNETQQRRRRRRRADPSHDDGGNEIGIAPSAVDARRVSSASGDALQDVYKTALRMLETGVASDCSSAMLAAAQDAMRVTIPAARPPAACGAGAASTPAEEEAATADMRLEGELERTLNECELTIQLLSLHSVAASPADDDTEADFARAQPSKTAAAAV